MKEGLAKSYYLSEKERIFEIYGEKCIVCKRPTRSTHHVVFRSDFPKNTDYHIVHNRANLVPLCPRCSDKLHNRA
jgi:5-methylcytosine-specific restriction endonuclease McrA